MKPPGDPLNTFGGTVIATRNEPGFVPTVTVRDVHQRDVELVWLGEMPPLRTNVVVTVYAKEDT